MDFFTILSLYSESSSSDSTEEVEELSCQRVFSDEDLLTLILLGIPTRKLICFTSVSKLWYSVITSPHFSSLRSTSNASLPLCPSGLFFQIIFCKSRVPNSISFAPLGNANQLLLSELTLLFLLVILVFQRYVSLIPVSASYYVLLVTLLYPNPNADIIYTIQLQINYLPFVKAIFLIAIMLHR